MSKSKLKSLLYNACISSLLFTANINQWDDYKYASNLDLSVYYEDQDVYRETIRRKNKIINELLEKIKKLETNDDKYEFLKNEKREIKEIFNEYYKNNDYLTLAKLKQIIIYDEAYKLGVSNLRFTKELENEIYKIIMDFTMEERNHLREKIPCYTRMILLVNRFEQSTATKGITEIQDIEKFNISKHVFWKKANDSTNDTCKSLYLGNTLAIEQEIYLALGYVNKFDKAVNDGFDVDLIEELMNKTYEYIKPISHLKIANVSMPHITIIKTVRNALKEFYGKAYVKEFDNAFKKGYIVLSNNNGYYTSYGKRINKITMTTTDNYNEAYYLAHEFGHYVENVYSEENNVSITKDEEILMEVPSILNEIIYTDYIRKNYNTNTNLVENVVKLHFEMLVNMTIIYGFYVEYELFILRWLGQKKSFFITKEELDYMWKSIPENFILKQEYVNLGTLDFYQARYMYGVMIAIKIYNRIKKDPNYLNTYLDYMRLKETLSPKERLEFLEIDTKDFSLVEETKARIDEMLFVIKSLEK